MAHPYQFEYTDSNGDVGHATRFADVPIPGPDETVPGEQIRFSYGYTLDKSDLGAGPNFAQELIELVPHYDKLVFQCKSKNTLEGLMDVLETNNVYVPRLVYSGVTFRSQPGGGDSSTHFSRCTFLTFNKCKFETDTFTPFMWADADHITFKNTEVVDIQGNSSSFKHSAIIFEGVNEYLCNDFQFTFHFPSLRYVEMKNVGDLYIPVFSSGLVNVRSLVIEGDVKIHMPQGGVFFAQDLRNLRKFVFNPDVPTDESDAFAHAVINEIKGRAESISVTCKKCGMFVTLRSQSPLDAVMFEVFEQGGQRYGGGGGGGSKKKKGTKKGQRELKQLVGEKEGHRTILTEDPRGAPIRYVRGADAFDEAIFATDFTQHFTDVHNNHDYHHLTTFPAIFRDTVRYMHGLSEDFKKAIYYYTSGKDSRSINEFLLDKIPAAELHAFQLRAMNTLVKDIFPRIPPVTSPFVVFRGYPMTTLDNGAFHSTTVRADLFTGAGDWYTNFDKKSLVAKPVESEAGTGCCIHVIRVMPGARVLYMQDKWAGISAYGEYEVLFAPFMGTFHKLRSAKDADSNILYHHWVYVPEGTEVGNKRTLEKRFNELVVPVNAPHPSPDVPQGSECFIRVPSEPSTRDTWNNPDAVATFVPGQSNVPSVFKSVKFLAHKLPTLMKLSKNAPHFDDGDAAGTLIFEPDGRIWIVHPTNKYVGYTSTFPKGTRDNREDLRKTAIRETYEETGLLVSLINYTGDCMGEGRINGAFAKLNRASGVTYYYLARRETGSPSDMGWESQAVSLVPVAELRNQHVGVRYVSTTNWDEVLMHQPALKPSDYTSQDDQLVDYIIDQADVIKALL